MGKAQCPNCGAEYDTTGIATICSHCQEPLPVAEMPMLGQPAAVPPLQGAVRAPAATTPSSHRRPCVKCGEPLYPTEMTCWKCGSPQVARPAPVAAPSASPAYPPPPPTPGPYAGPTPPPGPAGYPPPPPTPFAGTAYTRGVDEEVQKRANTALILGVIGLVCCNILSPFALFMGLSAKRDGAEGTATAAVVVGAIGCVGLVLGIIYGIVVVVAGVSGGAFPTP
jgi:hypothetical protein